MWALRGTRARRRRAYMLKYDFQRCNTQVRDTIAANEPNGYWSELLYQIHSKLLNEIKLNTVELYYNSNFLAFQLSTFVKIFQFNIERKYII